MSGCTFLYVVNIGLEGSEFVLEVFGRLEEESSVGKASFCEMATLSET